MMLYLNFIYLANICVFGETYIKYFQILHQNFNDILIIAETQKEIEFEFVLSEDCLINLNSFYKE